MTLILAGNYEQYLAHCKANHLSPAENRYVHRAVDLSKFANVEVEVVGEWWLNPAAEEVMQRERAGLLKVRRPGTPSILEEIEREATEVAERATIRGQPEGLSLGFIAKAWTEEWERQYTAEEKKIEESRAAFEYGEISEAEIYRGDFVTITGRLRVGMDASFRGGEIDFWRLVPIKGLEYPQLVELVVMQLRDDVKRAIIRALCEESGINPETFTDELYKERLAEAEKLILRNCLTPPPASR